MTDLPTQTGRRVTRYLVPISFFVVLIATWEVLARYLEIPAWLLPSPSAIIAEAAKWRGILLAHTGVTLGEITLGFIMASGGGIILAVAISYSETLGSILYPILVVSQSIPKVAIAPFFLIWVGYGITSKVLIVFLVAFFPIVVNTIFGLLDIEPDLLDLVRSFNASRVKTFIKVRLPSSLPSMFSGLKVGITLAVAGAVIGEFVGSDSGLGYLILSAVGELNTRLMFVCIAILAIIGIALFYLVAASERILIPWARSRSLRDRASVHSRKERSD